MNEVAVDRNDCELCIGHDGGAVTLCPLHEAAPAMLETLRAFMDELDEGTVLLEKGGSVVGAFPMELFIAARDIIKDARLA